MAVWHHNVEGAPYSSDYMDVDTIYRLIGKGFRLGLHGHQHRAQASHRYLHLPGDEPMAISQLVLGWMRAELVQPRRRSIEGQPGPGDGRVGQGDLIAARKFLANRPFSRAAGLRAWF